MAFCQNCGQQLPDNANVCPNCGTVVNAQAASQQAAPQQQASQQAAPQQQTPVVNPTVMADPDVQQNRGIAWLAYVGLLFLIPMFARKNSPYCRYHVKQGATLCAVDIAYEITKAILLAIIDAIFPGGWLFVHSSIYNTFSLILNAGSIFLFVIAIIGIVNAASGKKNELLLIGKIPWIANLLDKFYNSNSNNA